MVHEAGFQIESLHEPVADEETAKKYPEVADTRDGGVGASFPNNLSSNEAQLLASEDDSATSVVSLSPALCLPSQLSAIRRRTRSSEPAFGTSGAWDAAAASSSAAALSRSAASPACSTTAFSAAAADLTSAVSACAALTAAVIGFLGPARTLGASTALTTVGAKKVTTFKDGKRIQSEQSPVPMTPARFDSAIQSKIFTDGKTDADVVSRCSPRSPNTRN